MITNTPASALRVTQRAADAATLNPTVVPLARPTAGAGHQGGAGHDAARGVAAHARP